MHRLLRAVAVAADALGHLERPDGMPVVQRPEGLTVARRTSAQELEVRRLATSLTSAT